MYGDTASLFPGFHIDFISSPNAVQKKDHLVLLPLPSGNKMILQGVGVDLSYRPNQFDIYIPCISFPFIPLLLLIFFVWLPFNNCPVKSRVWLRHWRIEFIKHWKENEQRNFWLEIKTMKQFRQSPPPPGPEKVFCFACPSGQVFLRFSMCPKQALSKLMEIVAHDKFYSLQYIECQKECFTSFSHLRKN